MGHGVALSWGYEMRMLKVNERSSRIGALLEHDIFYIIKG